jgi:hypothetical protein
MYFYFDVKWIKTFEGMVDNVAFKSNSIAWKGGNVHNGVN